MEATKFQKSTYIYILVINIDNDTPLLTDFLARSGYPLSRVSVSR